MGEDGVIYANKVVDPAYEHIKKESNENTGFTLVDGLADAVKSFRQAASFIVHVER
jgi:hypothetical protein